MFRVRIRPDIGLSKAQTYRVSAETGESLIARSSHASQPDAT